MREGRGIDYEYLMVIRVASWEAGVEYLVNETGERTRVVLTVEEYDELPEAREQLEDRLAADALQRDKARIESGEAELIPWEESRRRRSERPSGA